MSRDGQPTHAASNSSSSHWANSAGASEACARGGQPLGGEQFAHLLDERLVLGGVGQQAERRRLVCDHQPQPPRMPGEQVQRDHRPTAAAEYVRLFAFGCEVFQQQVGVLALHLHSTSAGRPGSSALRE
ncbi:hypothetical protein [Nocardia abscessus]|uniref:hypothetical protein n=1 Tax=Nocardia abscessus TaxID=120957 RepID=UPI0024569925|nr:hypothetical protein [Nocardia abscessus]